MSFEVVVIGAGPAGLCAAIVLAARGLSTLICDSARLPVDKACGEGLLPSALANLRDLGVPMDKIAEHGRPFDGVRYVSHAGRVAQASFAEGVGLGLRRVMLSQVLAEHARTLPHLKLVQGARGRLVPEPAKNGRAAHFSVQVERSLLHPRLIIGADGLNSHVRRQAGIAAPVGSPARFGVRQYFGVSPWSDKVEVYWSRLGEAYVTPTGDERVNVAFLWERAHLPRDTEEGIVAQLLEEFPSLAHKLRGAQRLGRARAAGPLHQWPARPVKNGLVLVGDAAGYVDAVTGEGVGIAVKQALLLGELIAPLLARGSERVLPERALSSFIDAQRAATRGSRKLTKMLLWLRKHPALLERSIAALAADPALFRYLLSANQGQVPLLGVPARSALGLARRLALPSREGPGTAWEGSHDAIRHSS